MDCPAQAQRRDETDSGIPADLAEFGVALFDRPKMSRTPSAAALRDLTLRVLAAREPRFIAALPCVFVRHDEIAAEAVAAAAARSHGQDRDTLGLVWRLARSFAIQWAPDIFHVLGRTAHLPPLDFEPEDLPAPEEDLGERCPAIARELHAEDPGGNIVIDLVDAFRTWLRQAEIDSRATAHA